MRKSTGAVLIVGAAPSCADLLYATGFKTSDPVVYVRHGGRGSLVVPRMELGRARRSALSLRILTPEDLGVKPRDRHRLSGWAVGLLRTLGLRRVRVGGTFPIRVARGLERAGIDVRVAAGALFPQRACKTEAEVRRMRRVQRAAAAAMRAAVAMIGAARADSHGRLRLGGRLLTAARVRAAIHHTLIARGCLCAEPIVARGAQAADPHRVGDGSLRAGEAVVIDIFPQDLGTGYWGDLTRTVCHGPPPRDVRRMHAAVRAAQRAALQTVRAGVRTARVHAAAAGELERRGFAAGSVHGRPSGFIHGAGHGVGLEIHEAPSLRRGGRGVLRVGHVVTVEPGLYYPGRAGVRMEDTVVVTRRGWRALAACPKGLRADTRRRRGNRAQ